MHRHAIYFAPPADHPLARFAAAWLGRCPEGRLPGPRPVLPSVDSGRLETVVAEPARYGFHGTLKPPFRLAAGRDVDDLDTRLDDLARGLRPFALPALRLRAIGRFLALVPGAPSPTLDAVAAACVTGLDAFRAAPTAAELERRRRGRLDPRQEELLARWGYPHVLDRFQFHLTLTGPLPPDEQAPLERALAPLVAPHCQAPLPFTDLARFVEPAPGAPFTLARRFPLGGPPAS
ncbi:DUF1045 domain-containing protein [Stella sp.]|uniref:DUF1045 domain-containing protein n=1 Tax=Stella sp. TaxID=2912054 RepID=UPI0035B10EB9